MSNARDKANIPSLNFSSTGIDDNATSTKLATTSTGINVTGDVLTSSSFQVDSSGVGYYVGGGSTGTTAIGLLKNDSGKLTLDTDGTRSINFKTGGTLRQFIDGATGDISFYEDTGTTAKLFWDASTESLGIGTSSPSNLLHIFSSSPRLIIQDGGTHGTNSAPRLEFQDNSSIQGFVDFADDGTMRIDQLKPNPLTIHTNNVERMRITSSGNIGIGTSSPGTKLSVNKNVDNNDYIAEFISQTYTGLNDNGILVQTTGNSSGGGELLTLKRDTTDIFTVNEGDGLVYAKGNVAVGTTTPYGKLNVSGGTSTDLFVVSGFTGGETNYNMSIRNPSTNKITFRQRWFTTSQQDQEVMNFASGNVNVVGAFSKGSGSFKIDHPLPEKTNTHNLIHSFVEAPQADNIYRGKIDLVNGTATVNIDTVAGMSEGTFVLLNREIQCFTSNETGWIAVKGSVSGNILTITAQDNTCDDTISWMVIGERQDQHMYDTDWTDENGKVIVEPLKVTTP